MYCRKCGAQLSGADEKCSQCGSDNAVYGNGNGFWDLFDQARSSRSVNVKEKSSDSKAFKILFMVSLIVCIILGSMIYLKMTEIRELEEQKVQLQQEYDQLQKDKDQLQKDKDQLQKDKDQLQQDYNRLREANAKRN